MKNTKKNFNNSEDIPENVIKKPLSNYLDEARETFDSEHERLVDSKVNGQTLHYLEEARRTALESEAERLSKSDSTGKTDYLEEAREAALESEAEMLSQSGRSRSNIIEHGDDWKDKTETRSRGK